MPDGYGNFKGIALTHELPWLQRFERGDRVRIIAPDLQGRRGTVTRHAEDVWVLLDNDEGEQVPCRPGELRRLSESATENQNRDRLRAST